jgi:hypothetical protein
LVLLIIYERFRHASEIYDCNMSWNSWFESQQGLGIFLYTTMSRLALGPTHPPIQWVPGTLSLGVKRPGREADHSPPSSAKVKNVWNYASPPQYMAMAWCSVKKISQGQMYLLPLIYYISWEMGDIS